MYFLEKMNDDDDADEFLGEINCISHVEVKGEVIIPESNSDGESTLSDDENNSDTKLQECIICCKYRSMFIILKNHDCQLESNNQCKFCNEITHWSDCFKRHKESHTTEKDSDPSSDSTTSDREEVEGKCKVCLKYEFMVPLLKSHICRVGVDEKCPECSEALHWVSCYKNHVDSHDTKDFVKKVKEENSSDSTISDNEEIQKLLSPFENQYEKCPTCLKYQGMFIILEENHVCHLNKSNKKCDKCKEILDWYCCFDKHRNSHGVFEKNMCDNIQLKKSLHFSRKSDCGICLKLNSIVIRLGKNHKCINSKTCLICQEASYWLSCLKNHKQTEVITNQKDREEMEGFKSLAYKTNCSVCSKFRTAIVNLKEHSCRLKKGRQKCDTCLEIAFWLKNFKNHAKTHAEEMSPLRNFLSCSNCGKRFSGEKMLNVHKSYCKSSSFTCDICHRKFLNIFSLKKHKILKVCRSSGIS